MSHREPEPLRPVFRWALVGAGAGVLIALGDFGASWLWLPGWRDRGELFLRIFGLEVPLAALLGGLLGALHELSEFLLRRAWIQTAPKRVAAYRRRLVPLALTLLAAPFALIIARLLFSGGRMSRLPLRDLWVVLAFAGLLLGGWGALSLGRRYHEVGMLAGTRRARLMAIVPLICFVVVSKLDQHLYPKLYEYLHGLLSVVAFALACLAVSLLAERSPALKSRARRAPLFPQIVLGLLCLTHLANVLTLESNQNVRVGLFDPRAATSRSIMLGLDPLLSDPAARRSSRASLRRARRARARRQVSQVRASLPVREGAHILLVSVDALRADHLGSYGYDRDLSPALDRLADSSVVFERAYAAAPHSSYSLCSLMVSEYLHETVDLGLPLPEATLPGLLGEGGYHTAGFYTEGIFHTEGERLALYKDGAFGFARHDHANRVAEGRTDAVLAEAARVVARGEPPSMFWVHYFDVHEPYRETSLGTSEMDRYDGEIRNVDRAFERLLGEMRELFEREVIVIVTADHGEEFRDHGGVYHGSTLYEEQIRVPLIIHVPGLEPRRVAEPVELVDLAPTILALSALPVAEAMRGDDLRPLLAGTDAEMGPAFAAVSGQRMVVRWPHKLVANLRLRLFELYDLEADPLERQNLAEGSPRLLDSLEGELYAWLDSLQTGDAERSPASRALDLGRLGDPRALTGLQALLLDEGEEPSSRQEAAQILGEMGDAGALDALEGALGASASGVSAEAAIALGRMGDERGLLRLRRLVFSEDPGLRARAAIALGALRDPLAVPGLIDALYISRDRRDREEAVRALGRIGDARAVEPLIRMIPEFRVRYLTVVALGELGDPRVYDPLVDMLSWETHSNVRDNVARALGQLGDPRAIPHILPLLAESDDYKYAPEALVRLDAIGRGAIGGVDLSPSSTQAGFGPCVERPRVHDTDYLNRTYCETRAPVSALSLAIPESVANAEEVALILRIRWGGEGDAPTLRLRVDERNLLEAQLSPGWTQHRVVVPGEWFRGSSGEATLFIESEAPRAALDHILLVPLLAPRDGA